MTARMATAAIDEAFEARSYCHSRSPHWHLAVALGTGTGHLAPESAPGTGTWHRHLSALGTGHAARGTWGAPGTRHLSAPGTWAHLAQALARGTSATINTSPEVTKCNEVVI